jgi:predicted RNase H-like nuclease (RuvC/YqgF family)
MNPEANPFKMKRPIDIANDEIKALKKTIMEMRSEMVQLKNHLKPVREDYLKRLAEEEENEKEYVIESRPWFFGY